MLSNGSVIFPGVTASMSIGTTLPCFPIVLCHSPPFKKKQGQMCPRAASERFCLHQKKKNKKREKNKKTTKKNNNNNNFRYFVTCRHVTSVMDDLRS